MNIASEEFQQEFVRDMLQKAMEPVRVEMTAAQAFSIVGELQLALRHPANKGPSSVIARAFCDELIQKLGTTDVLLRGLKAGYNPDFDVTFSSSP